MRKLGDTVYKCGIFFKTQTVKQKYVLLYFILNT